MNTPDLPPLPEPMYDARVPRPYGQSYSATQMRTYAAAAVLAEQAKSEAMRADVNVLLEYFNAQRGLISTIGNPYTTADDEHKAEDRAYTATEEARKVANRMSAAIRAEPKEQQP
jgi:ribosomal protein L34E